MPDPACLLTPACLPDLPARPRLPACLTYLPDTACLPDLSACLPATTCLPDLPACDMLTMAVLRLVNPFSCCQSCADASWGSEDRNCSNQPPLLPPPLLPLLPSAPPLLLLPLLPPLLLTPPRPSPVPERGVAVAAVVAAGYPPADPIPLASPLLLPLLPPRGSAPACCSLYGAQGSSWSRRLSLPCPSPHAGLPAGNSNGRPRGPCASTSPPPCAL